MSKPYESWSEIEQGIDDTYSEKDFLAVIDRDRFNATLSALAALRIELEEMRTINLGQIESFRKQRDALTKQVEALEARAGHFHSCGLELNNATREAAEFKARAEKAERDLGNFFENLDINSLNKALTDTRRERDSLRERLGDAERVLNVARELHPLPLDAALAEFDAKWGKR